MRGRQLIAFVLVASALVVIAAGGATGTPASGLTFTEPVQLEAHAPIGTAFASGERQPSGEPSIKVDPTGIIYVAGVSSVVQASPLWVSTNGGRSFDQVTTPLNFRENSPYGAEGDIAIDNQRRMYFADTAVSTIALSRWSPPEKPGDKPTWEYTYPHEVGVLPGVDDRPWLAYGVDSDGTESLWLYLNHAIAAGIYRSTDGGLTWDQPLFDTEFSTAMIAAPRTSSKDLFAFGECDSPIVLCARITRDAGESWSEVTVSKVSKGRDVGSIFVASAIDAAQNLYGIWSEADFDDEAKNDTPADNGCDIYYAVSSDWGKTWSPKRLIDGPKGCSAFPWITAGDAGRIAVAWYETSAQGPNENTVPDDAKWFVKAAVITSATTEHPTITSGVADPLPVHIGKLERELWDYFQIATGPDGRFHIAYVEDVTSGPDGWAGTNTPEGYSSKDTQYVAQRGGPLLVASATAKPSDAGRRPAPRPTTHVKGSKQIPEKNLPGTGVGSGWGLPIVTIAAMIALWGARSRFPRDRRRRPA